MIRVWDLYSGSGAEAEGNHAYEPGTSQKAHLEGEQGERKREEGEGKWRKEREEREEKVKRRGRKLKRREQKNKRSKIRRAPRPAGEPCPAKKRGRKIEREKCQPKWPH